MSHFYSNCQGSKGLATRAGHKTKGATANAFGWDLGGRVVTTYNPTLDTDVVTFYITRENNSKSSIAATFAVVNGKLVCLQTSFPELLV